MKGWRYWLPWSSASGEASGHSRVHARVEILSALSKRLQQVVRTLTLYTLARTHLAGLYGMNEGLAVLAALVVRQWGSLWPQP
ncbi:type VI secretion system ImpA family N-terminal domain-containing protein, partial [Enterococcus faecium]|uniref:type VI secretion system ImpA family N-terminal domain-containing protein n=1 Tax=Enterococcus faecium TaxID=1352 RepID=UPI0015C6CF70